MNQIKDMKYMRLININKYIMMYNTWIIRSYIEEKKMISSKKVHKSHIIVPLQVVILPDFSNVPCILEYSSVR